MYPTELSSINKDITINITITVMILSFQTDRPGWANSADPDQTAPRGSALFAIPSASFGRISLR